MKTGNLFRKNSSLLNEQEVDAKLASKQDILVSGTNIKTINGNNILGTGDIDIDIASVKNFNTLEDLKLDTSLKIGDVVQTLGYYEINDGGGAIYKIGILDSNSYQEEISAGLYATLITGNEINISQFGAHGDGVTDDSDAIQKAIDYAKEKKLKVIANKEKTFLINNSIDISNLYINFNYATFTTNSAIDMFVADSIVYYGELRNVTFNANTALSCINVKNSRKVYFEKIDIYNLKNTGIIYNEGYEVMFRDINIQGTREDLTSVGILCRTGDSYIENVVMIDCCTAIHNIDGFNYYNNVHAWMWTKILIPNSIFLKCSGGKLVLNNCFSDTYQYAIYQYNYIPTLLINNFANVYNTGIYLPDIAASNNPVFMYCEQDSGNALTRITNSFMDGYSEDINTKLTNLSEFGGDIVNCIFKDFDKTLAYTLLEQSNLSENVSIRESDIQKVSKMVTINNIIDITDITDNKTFNVGSIPYYFRPFKEYIGAGYYSSGKYGVTGLCYVYIGTNGAISVTLPDSVSGVVNIKLNLTFITHKEY